MSAKFTPGPWLHGPEYDEVRSVDGRVVAKCSGWHGTKRAESNARLIAAAPDLAEALRALMPHVESANYGGSDLLTCIEDARAALAKAGV